MAKYEARFYPPSAENESDVLEFLDSLDDKAAAKCLTFIEQFEQHGFDLPHGWLEKVEGVERLWALRPEYRNIEYRFLFTVVGRQAVFVLALRKKSPKLRKKDLQLARRCAREVQEYYGAQDR